MCSRCVLPGLPSGELSKSTESGYGRAGTRTVTRIPDPRGLACRRSLGRCGKMIKRGCRELDHTRIANQRHPEPPCSRPQALKGSSSRAASAPIIAACTAGTLKSSS